MEKEGVSLKAIGITDYESEASAQTALATLRSQSRLKVESVARKVTHTPPPLLYDLTALQKDANRRHGFSADKTLSIAQSLYEKKITTIPQTISEFYIFQIINRITPNKEEKGYDLETSEFLSPSLFCNVSKTTYLTLQR